MSDYFRQTRSATYSFWAALPLLLLYEWLIILGNAGSQQEVRVSAEFWIKGLLGSLGVTSHLLLGATVIVIGLIIYVSEHRESIKLQPRNFVLMVIESAIYAVVITLAITIIVQRLATLAPAPAIASVPLQVVIPLNQGYILNLALSIGAGLYEELVFRLLLFGGLYLVIDSLLDRKGWSMLIAAIVGSLLFSAAHHVGQFGDPLALPVFTYRFLYGMALQGLFIARGFGVAAWTHALYDVMVVTVHGTL